MLGRSDFRDYTWRRFLGDLSGGAIASLIALPYGLALASLMGLPPILGVYTSIISAPFCVLLGRNPVLIGGTSSVTVPFIAAAVRAQGISGAAKVCISASIIMMAFCVLRLGRHVAKVPHSVVAGFSCGIGGMMIISQLRTIFALHAPAGGWKESMLMQLLQVVQNLGHMRVQPCIVALTVAVIATMVIYWRPRSPGPLFGVVVALIVGKVFGWHETEVGTLFSGLPSPVGFHWESSDVWNVLPAAFGLAFVSSVDSLMTSRVVEHFRGRHKLMKKHDADMELGAYGIANLIGGTFGAPTSVGIPARSLANVQCGATTVMSNAIHAVFLVGFLTLGTHFLAQIPLAALAGVTAWMGARLLDWSAWRRLGKMRRVDAAAFVGTAAAVLMINAVAAITIGCSFHVLHYVYRRFFPLPSAKQVRQPSAPAPAPLQAANAATSSPAGAAAKPR
ncbi:MAG: SulP family inorganic anion transporter [Thermoguttaceae bacterium]